ncbi:MAG: NERD domain-containing protein [Thiomicrorhabdus sp.]|nr:NERD domain-containing protein [Thiomicrorhabdus sp.]
MIIKEKESVETSSSLVAAGERQEESVAFYLRRAFKDHESVFVFHDLHIAYGGEFAQIDHLVLYRYGFILIESKSITGEVKVNSLGEWSRSYLGKWKGMPSPIKQVELQIELLKSLLNKNTENLLRKVLKVLQGRFGGRDWHPICAISSNAIIDRAEIPKEISNRMVKSEFLVDRVKELMNIPSKLKQATLLMADTRPDFSVDEMERICKFLLAVDKKAVALKGGLKSTIEPKISLVAHLTGVVSEPANPEVHEQPTGSSILRLTCKQCGGIDALEGKWGKYGYYVHCPSCEANTSMKVACPECNSTDVKNRKDKQDFYLACQSCSKEFLLHRNSQ